MIRLQKLLAQTGLGSRRTVEAWIRAGRVSVAGRLARLGDRAAPNEEIRLDGRKLDLGGMAASSPELLLYYKPEGEVTTRRDPQGRRTVFERLPPPCRGRWICVGRLDVSTSGLLLLTTDGELAHRLMHPSSRIEREYLVRVRGRPRREVLRRLLEGVELEDGPARFDLIRALEGASGEAGERGTPRRVHCDEGASRAPPGSHRTFRVVLHEGRNREVRRLWSAVGFEVSRLRRIRYGPIRLPRDMRPGTVRRASAALLTCLATAAAPGLRPPPCLTKAAAGATGPSKSRASFD